MICWQNAERQKEISREVENICGLPGVVGFLDGTHIDYHQPSMVKGIFITEKDFRPFKYRYIANVKVSCLYKCFNVITLH